jgi:hypothetical protein
MSKRIVVFDFDETLGSFSQLYLLWISINKILNIGNNEKKIILFQLLDLFPDFFRPSIIDILKYVLTNKLNNKCKEVIIYTNNNGPIKWCNYIIEYLNNKTNKNSNVIDKIIKAFIVDGKKREILRTSNDKSITDLIKYTKYSKNMKICFIDDQEHKNMINDNVYYINVLPYHFNMSFKIMAEKYYENILNENIISKKNFVSQVLKLNANFVSNINKNDTSNIQPIISKQILTYLDKFFNKL